MKQVESISPTVSRVYLAFEDILHSMRTAVANAGLTKVRLTIQLPGFYITRVNGEHETLDA
ncbi:hypothetical protein AWV79_06750 [Cupriavidus sp. UYMMa02A]|nr:hypothetical protein AWV79_06750 [Cupriavidus sp. UYMMa02A]